MVVILNKLWTNCIGFELIPDGVDIHLYVAVAGGSMKVHDRNVLFCNESTGEWGTMPPSQFDKIYDER